MPRMGLAERLDEREGRVHQRQQKRQRTRELRHNATSPTTTSSSAVTSNHASFTRSRSR
jgi:hypothetical protein